jgi:hypothetical protein
VAQFEPKRWVVGRHFPTALLARHGDPSLIGPLRGHGVNPYPEAAPATHDEKDGSGRPNEGGANARPLRAREATGSVTPALAGRSRCLRSGYSLAAASANRSCSPAKTDLQHEGTM